MILMQKNLFKSDFFAANCKKYIEFGKEGADQKLELIICDRISVKTRIVAMRFTMNKQKMFLCGLTYT